MNILITSAGRRGYIIDYFKKALKGDGKVYAGNSDIFAPAFSYADEYVVTPLIYDKEYIPFLVKFCKEKQISVIISLFDIDLWVLTNNKFFLEEHGIRVIVSDKSVINICNDKWNTYRFCTKNKILAPQTFLEYFDAETAINEGKISFPVIIKPRWGMGSLAVYQADNVEEMKILFRKCVQDIQETYLKYEAAFDRERCVIIQEKLNGQEYGMDIINDLNGTFCVNVVRKKIAMRSGETDCAIVEKNDQMDLLAKIISKLLGHIGNLDVDLFVNNGEVYLLEMNARFGGGYPFSYYAGVDLPQAIVRWVMGKKIDEELAIKKYNQIIQKDIQFVNLSESVDR